MTSVNKCLSDIIKYVDVMIDNADMYYYDGGYCETLRIKPEGAYEFASADIENIVNNAIDIVYNQDRKSVV